MSRPEDTRSGLSGPSSMQVREGSLILPPTALASWSPTYLPTYLPAVLETWELPILPTPSNPPALCRECPSPAHLKCPPLWGTFQTFMRRRSPLPWSLLASLPLPQSRCVAITSLHTFFLLLNCENHEARVMSSLYSRNPANLVSTAKV